MAEYLIGKRTYQIDYYATNDKHVFVVGDAYYGPKNVAAAIKDGRELASRLIGGRDGI